MIRRVGLIAGPSKGSELYQAKVVEGSCAAIAKKPIRLVATPSPTIATFAQQRGGAVASDYIHLSPRPRPMDMSAFGNWQTWQRVRPKSASVGA